MEKNQYELCLEVLRRLNRAGVLKDIMLIGSWCLPFYREYFSGVTYAAAIKTRDIALPADLDDIHRDLQSIDTDLSFHAGYQKQFVLN